MSADLAHALRMSSPVAGRARGRAAGCKPMRGRRLLWDPRDRRHRLRDLFIRGGLIPGGLGRSRQGLADGKPMRERCAGSSQPAQPPRRPAGTGHAHAHAHPRPHPPCPLSVLSSLAALSRAEARGRTVAPGVARIPGLQGPSGCEGQWTHGRSDGRSSPEVKAEVHAEVHDVRSIRTLAELGVGRKPPASAESARARAQSWSW